MKFVLINMSSELEQPFINELHEEDDEARDWDLLIAFNELRHREKIQGSKKVAQTWRMKERVWRDLSIAFFGIKIIEAINCHISY